jgi:hypothetical protein
MHVWNMYGRFTDEWSGRQFPTRNHLLLKSIHVIDFWTQFPADTGNKANRVTISRASPCDEEMPFPPSWRRISSPTETACCQMSTFNKFQFKAAMHASRHREMALS